MRLPTHADVAVSHRTTELRALARGSTELKKSGMNEAFITRPSHPSSYKKGADEVKIHQVRRRQNEEIRRKAFGDSVKPPPHGRKRPHNPLALPDAGPDIRSWSGMIPFVLALITIPDEQLAPDGNPLNLGLQPMPTLPIDPTHDSITDEDFTRYLIPLYNRRWAISLTKKRRLRAATTQNWHSTGVYPRLTKIFLLNDSAQAVTFVQEMATIFYEERVRVLMGLGT